jgi:hypothetical protein
MTREQRRRHADRIRKTHVKNHQHYQAAQQRSHEPHGQKDDRGSRTRSADRTGRAT